MSSILAFSFNCFSMLSRLFFRDSRVVFSDCCSLVRFVRLVFLSVSMVVRCVFSLASFSFCFSWVISDDFWSRLVLLSVSKERRWCVSSCFRFESKNSFSVSVFRRRVRLLMVSSIRSNSFSFVWMVSNCSFMAWISLVV